MLDLEDCVADVVQTGIPLQLPDNRGYSDSVAQAFISESTSQK